MSYDGRTIFLVIVIGVIVLFKLLLLLPRGGRNSTPAVSTRHAPLAPPHEPCTPRTETPRREPFHQTFL